MHSERRNIWARLAPVRSATNGFAIALTVCVVLLAPGSYPADLASSIVVSDAWIRWLPENLPAAGYVTLRNAGDQPVTLVGASSPEYGAVMFHESRNQKGIDRMVALQSVRIAPHCQVSFAPAGYHIMLMQPTKAINPGDRVSLTLRFADGQSLQIRFAVRRPDGSAVTSATRSTG
jgi:periplasmic copper chaperone A